jgi:hypothetical protein
VSSLKHYFKHERRDTKMKNILICLLALTACSAPMEVENVDVSQQSLGTCPRPTGGGGDPSFPFSSYITGVHENAAQPWKLNIESTNVATGAKTTSVLDFGGISMTRSQARMTEDGVTPGYGWSGTRLVKIEKRSGLDCGSNSNLKCWLFYGPGESYPTSKIIFFDKRYSSSVSDGTLNFGAGATQIFAYAKTASQYVKFAYDTGLGTTGTIFEYFEGPELDRCDYP